jgi:hypothetical protein
MKSITRSEQQVKMKFRMLNLIRMEGVPWIGESKGENEGAPAKDLLPPNKSKQKANDS